MDPDPNSIESGSETLPFRSCITYVGLKFPEERKDLKTCFFYYKKRIYANRKVNLHLTNTFSLSLKNAHFSELTVIKEEKNCHDKKDVTDPFF